MGGGWLGPQQDLFCPMNISKMINSPITKVLAPYLQENEIHSPFIYKFILKIYILDKLLLASFCGPYACFLMEWFLFYQNLLHLLNHTFLKICNSFSLCQGFPSIIFSSHENHLAKYLRSN